MKKIILLFISIFTVSFVNAQQLPQFSQYMMNDFVVNPAVAGKKPFNEIISSNRYQWRGIVDAPRTYVLSMNGPSRINNMGLGGILFTDITGPTRRTGVSLSYAYHLKLTETIKLGMGLSAGLLQFAVDGSQITLKDPDPSLGNLYQSVLMPDFGFGLHGYSDKFYFGLSAPQILNNKLRFSGDNPNLSRLTTHFYITGGYKFDNLIENFVFETFTLIKFANPAPIQIDIGGRALYKEKMWLGLSYRTHDAFAILTGYNYKTMTFGYSYDFTTSNIRKYSTGTHELVFGFRFNQQKKQ